LAPIVDDVDRERLEAIRRAIGDDALRLFAQPIYQGANALRVVRAVEIFVHCDDGSESSAPAARWMPTAKKYGLLGAVDRWVFAATMQWLRERHQRLAAPVDIHVNVAVSSLLDAEYINYVEQELRAYRQAAERVVFECDDDEVYDAVRHSGAGLRAAMARLAALGCGFMLDGAGAGTVSVAQRLPFDGLKLDCGSIRADQGDGVDSLSWRYALEMSRALGMRVVFKNVIGASDLAHIESLLTDTDNLQGEYFDAAAPLTALSEALSSRAGAPLVDVRAQSNNVLPQ
jgi:EAL domain-containing protein (putative c-di-GMP-specific phosphodiesterase class I)